MSQGSAVRMGGESHLPPFLATLKHWRWPYIFIAPFFISFLIFDLFPIIFAIYLSFMKWGGLGAMKWVGFSNYQLIFKDSNFWLGLKNTSILWLGHIFFLIALAFMLAVFLNSPTITGRSIYRTFIYLPNVTPIAVMGLVFGFLLETNFGLINSLLSIFHIPPVPWLAEPGWAKVSVILVNLWGATGWYMVILLAGLQNIDPTLYESAAIDGAGGWDKLIYITVPSMKGLFVFCFITETIGSFQIFIEPYVLFNGTGGPQNGALTSALYMYHTAFGYHNFGYASAMSFVLFAIIVVASIIQVRLVGEEQMI
jgi:lactose/L-arabinose transport system permease protein